MSSPQIHLQPDQIAQALLVRFLRLLPSLGREQFQLHADGRNHHGGWHAGRRQRGQLRAPPRPVHRQAISDRGIRSHEVEAAHAEADAAPFPAVEDVWKDVYAEPYGPYKKR